MKVLVTGGTGFIGRTLVHRLSADGHECIVVSRDPARAATLGLPAETSLVGDVAQSPAVDAVVLLAGESAAGLWTRRKRAAIIASRVEGTRRVVEWMRAAPSTPGVLVSASAVGYYGHRPGEVLDEASARDPAAGFRSSVCVRWEAEARRAGELGIRDATVWRRARSRWWPSRRAAADSPTPSFVRVKSGMIYGCGDPMLDHLSRSVRTFPIFPLVGMREQPIRPVAVWVHYGRARVFELTMKTPLAARAQVRILSEGVVEPGPRAERLPDDLLPQTRFTDDQIKRGLPEASGFGLRDLRWVD